VLPTGVGKTVVATALIARRARSTLIIVNRRALLDQWSAQLALFLGIAEADIGQIGASKNPPTGRIDLATMQTLARGELGPGSLDGSGLVIVDVCHHVAASSFERVLSRVPARFVLGLTATPKRRDGHHPIMHMQLGPIRFEGSAKQLSTQRAFDHRYFVRRTEFSSPTPREALAEIQTELSEDQRRNSFILDDSVAALREGRSPLVLCQRREHVALLADRLQRYARNLFVLVGGMSVRQRRSTFEALRALGKDDQRLIIATGSYAGEGFDDPRLDTLMLAAPIAWKGTLAQYAGRLHRLHPDKRDVWIFDYVDESVPALARMFEKRRRGYASLGYTEGDPPTDFEMQTDPSAEWGEEWFDDQPSIVAG
jgi:superfamily II DNA or RNA helicase